MNNEERFRRSFNEVEAYLRRSLDYGNDVPFKALVEDATEKDKVVRRFKADLLNYGDLRNAIVHSSTKKFLAEPFEETVNNLEMIWEQIKNPPRLDIFIRVGLLKCEANDKINDILQIMKENNYSQIPVYKDNILFGLLTTDTVSRWLAYELKTNEIVGDEEIVENVMKHTENNNNYDIVSRNKSLVETIDLFQINYSKGEIIAAVLITENGKKHEKLLGIATPYDIPEMEKRIRPI